MEHERRGCMKCGNNGALAKQTLQKDSKMRSNTAVYSARIQSPIYIKDHTNQQHKQAFQPLAANEGQPRCVSLKQLAVTQRLPATDSRTSVCAHTRRRKPWRPDVHLRRAHVFCACIYSVPAAAVNRAGPIDRARIEWPAFCKRDHRGQASTRGRAQSHPRGITSA